MKLLKWLFGTRKPALNKPVVSSSVSCGCDGKELYDVDVFGGKQSEKMKLCKDHIKSKCEEGFLVAL
jgi:hypothetical protein